MKAMNFVKTLALAAVSFGLALGAWAGGGVLDFTLVLSGGKAYMNTVSGNEITDEMALMGLSYADGAWKMNGFAFRTSATTALDFEDESATLNVSGVNTIASGDTTTDATCGINCKALTITGGSTADTLTVNAGSASRNSRGIYADSLTVNTVTLKAVGGDSPNYASFGVEVEALTVNDATLTASVSGTGEDRIGVYRVESCTVTGTGVIVATGNMVGIFGASETAPNATATATGTETVLTWSELGRGYVYKNGDDYVASVTLTAAGAWVDGEVGRVVAFDTRYTTNAYGIATFVVTHPDQVLPLAYSTNNWGKLLDGVAVDLLYQGPSIGTTNFVTASTENGFYDWVPTVGDYGRHNFGARSVSRDGQSENWLDGTILYTTNFNLTVTIAEPEGGTISVTTNGAAVASDASILGYTLLDLAATPAANWQFEAWSVTTNGVDCGGALGDRALPVTTCEMPNDDAVLTASFIVSEDYVSEATNALTTVYNDRVGYLETILSGADLEAAVADLKATYDLGVAAIRAARTPTAVSEATAAAEEAVREMRFELIPYVAPVYKVVDDPTSGIDYWVTNEIYSCTVVTSAAERVTWNAGWHVVTNDVTITGGVVVNGTVNLILGDTGSLTVDGVPLLTAGIAVNDGNAFSIFAQTNGTGRLTVVGNKFAAAIGSDQYKNSGAITFNGGIVTATGAKQGAAIGGGDGYKAPVLSGKGRNITVNGGNVTALGGYGSAGIGGGAAGTGENITINGGTVTATGGEYGAGIGNGYLAGGSKGILIQGGTVTATGDKTHQASGIGAGAGGTQASSGLLFANHVAVNVGNDLNGMSPLKYTDGGDCTAALKGKAYVKVVPADVAVDATGYVSLARALWEAEDGDTVTLYADVATTGTMVYPNKFPTSGCTLDLAGHTLTFNTIGSMFNETVKDGLSIWSNNVFLVVNGTLTTTADAGLRDVIRFYGTDLTLNDVVLDGTNIPAGKTSKANAMLTIESGTCGVYDSTITAPTGAADNTLYAIKFGNHSHPEYTMGTLSVINSTVAGDLLLNGGSYDEKGALVSGRYFYGRNVYSVWERACDVFVARTGVLPETGAEDNFVGQLYKSFAEALAAAQAKESGDTVTLLKDVTYDAAVTFENATLIDAAGHTYTGAVTIDVTKAAEKPMTHLGAESAVGPVTCIGAEGYVGGVNKDGDLVYGKGRTITVDPAAEPDNALVYDTFAAAFADTVYAPFATNVIVKGAETLTNDAPMVADWEMNLADDCVVTVDAAVALGSCRQLSGGTLLLTDQAELAGLKSYDAQTLVQLACGRDAIVPGATVLDDMGWNYTLTYESDVLKVTKAQTGVNFLDEESVMMNTRKYRRLLGDADYATELATGWYVVTNDVVYAHGLVVEGSVSLILCNGSTLTVYGDRLADGNGAGINVITDGAVTNSLTVYAQTNDMALAGALYAEGDYEGGAGIGGGWYEDCGKVRLYGGDVTAIGGYGSAGIGGGFGGTARSGIVIGKNGTLDAEGDCAAGVGAGLFAEEDAADITSAISVAGDEYLYEDAGHKLAASVSGDLASKLDNWQVVKAAKVLPYSAAYRMLGEPKIGCLAMDWTGAAMRATFQVTDGGVPVDISSLADSDILAMVQYTESLAKPFRAATTDEVTLTRTADTAIVTLKETADGGFLKVTLP